MLGESADVARVSPPESLPGGPLVGLEGNAGDSMSWMGYGPAASLTDPQAAYGVDLWPTGDQIQYLATDLTLPDPEILPGPPELLPVADPGLGLDALLPAEPTADDIPTALARLSEGISEQLSRSKAFQRERNAPPSDARGPPRAPSVNGVAVALKCTSEFTKVLQAPALRTHGDSGAPDDASLGLVDTPTALLILSSYIQLTHLYEIIFRCLCRNFRDNPSAIGKCPASADSQFKVAGVSTIDGRLYIKLLIQVIEHHIGGLEKLLGLPTELTVVGGDAEKHGIFGDIGLRSIADAVMSRTEDPDGSARARIMSLRDAMREAKSLL